MALRKYVGKFNGYDMIRVDISNDDYAIIPDAFRLLNKTDAAIAKELWAVEFLHAKEYGKVIDEEIPTFLYFRNAEGTLEKNEQVEILRLVSDIWPHFDELKEFMEEGKGIPWIGDMIPGFFKVPPVPSAIHKFPEHYAYGAAVFRTPKKDI